MVNLKVNGFRTWLELEYGLQKKSAGDVVSRLNRAITIKDCDPELLLNNEIELFTEGLKKNSNFLNLPISSQAGILRSLKLYKKYIS
jgi:hypothetical protein